MVLGARFNKYRFASKLSGAGAKIFSTNLFAISTTFMMFIIVAHKENRATLGLLSLGLTISALSNQLLDGGLSQYVIRDQIRNPETESKFYWFLRVRTKRFFYVCTISFVLLSIRYHLKFALLEVLLIFMNMAYGNITIRLQSQLKFNSLAKIQIANGFGFLTTILIYNFLQVHFHMQNILIVPIVSLLPVFLMSLLYVRPLTFQKHQEEHKDSDKKFFSLAFFGNVITSNSPIVVFGAHSPALAGEYAIIQQPALFFTPISYVANVLSQSVFFSSSKDRLLKYFRVIKIALVLSVPLIIMFGLGFTFVLDFLYKSKIDLVCIILLTGTGGIGIFTTLMLNLSLAFNRAAFSTTVSWVQTIVVVSFSFTATYVSNLRVMAFGEFFSRFLGIIVLLFLFNNLKMHEEQSETS